MPRRKKTAVEQTMLDKYRDMPSTKRMAAAQRLVEDEGYSQSAAARVCGVSRPRLNERLKAAQQRQAEFERRSADARQERAVASPPDSLSAPPVARPGPLHVMGELRRVPPMAEFNELYFNNVLCGDCGDIKHDTPDFHTEMMSISGDLGIKRALFNVPPFHAKSTIVTLRQTLHDLCRDPNSRTAVITKASYLAGRFMHQIGQHLTDPSLYEGAARNLIDDWGPFVGGSFNRQEIYVAGRRSSEKDPSVSAYGYGSAIYGTRLDRIVLDDIADLKNQKNPLIVEEMFLWIVSECESRIGKSGRLHVVGTRVGAGDIYSYLQPLEDYRVFRYPCIIDEDEGRTLWGEHFDITAAIKKRGGMPLDHWQLIYQNVDQPGLGASFTWDILERAHDMTRVLGDVPPHCALVVGLDPAGAGAQAGYTALVLMALDLETGHRYVIDLVNHKALKAPQLRDQIMDWAERYPLRELRVESNGLQSQLVQYNNEIVVPLTNKGVRVVGHITHAHNKWDGDFGVEAMASLYHNGMISVPYQGINTRNKIDELDKQLMQFPMGTVNDLVMAMWFAELGCREIWQRQVVPAYDPRMRVPGRIRRNRRVLDFNDRTARPPSPEEEAGYRMFTGTDPRERQLVNVGGGVSVY